MSVTLFPFQQEAVKRAIKTLKHLICVRVGGGKTLIAMFYARYLFKHNLIDKVVYACTVSAAVAVHSEYLEKFNIDVPTITEADKFIEFLKGDQQICIIKHSMFEKLGYDQNIIDEIRDICESKNLKSSLIIDEAHKLSNDTSITHTAYTNIKFMFERVILLTATPFLTDVRQLYGTVHLIAPKLWKNKTEFSRLYVDELTIMQGGRVRMKEVQAYKNLSDLRKRIEPYTFFHFPKIPLNFIDHKIKLKDYSEYDTICKGLLKESELARVEKGENKDVKD